MEIIGDPWKISIGERSKQRARMKIIGQCMEDEKLKHIDEYVEK